MPGPAHSALANLLFTMQEVVKANPQGGRPVPEKIFGTAIAGHFGATRNAMGLGGKWASLDETMAALATAVGSGAANAPAAVMSEDERMLAAAGDMDLAGYDVSMENYGGPTPTMCHRCGNTGRNNGACTKCGAFD
jgi:hypothetical protein